MTRRFCALFALGILIGCAAEPPPDPGIVEATRERLGIAQPADSVTSLLAKPLSAESAVIIALLNSPEIQAGIAEIGIDQGALSQAGLLDNPSLDLSTLAGSLTQNILSILTRAARQHLAEDRIERTRYLVASRLIDYAAMIRAAYYRLVADQQIAGLDAEITEASSVAAELAERQRRAGTLTARDQALWQKLYATAMLDQAKVEGDLIDDRELLNRLLGLWGGQTGWTAPDHLPDPPDAAMPPSDRLEANAIANRLDLAAARKDVDVAADALGLAQDYRFLPGFGLGLAEERGRDTGHQTGPALGLVLPIFDQGQAQSQSRDAEWRQSQFRLQALAIELRAQTRAAVARLAAAEARIRHYRQVVLPLAQQILADQQRFYNGMLLGVYDLLQAKRTEIETERDYVGMLRDYWLARTELERLEGGSLDAEPPAPRGAS